MLLFYQSAAIWWSNTLEIDELIDIRISQTVLQCSVDFGTAIYTYLIANIIVIKV